MLLNSALKMPGVGVGLLKNCTRVTLTRNIHSNIKNLSEQDVKHIQENNEFIIEVEGHKPAYLRYHKKDRVEIDLYTTVVPPSMEGNGVAKILAKAALKFVRETGLPVRPTCWYIDGYLARHPDPAIKVIPAEK